MHCKGIACTRSFDIGLSVQCQYFDTLLLQSAFTSTINGGVITSTKSKSATLPRLKMGCFSTFRSNVIGKNAFTSTKYK
jgi:hypothetical protein